MLEMHSRLRRVSRRSKRTNSAEFVRKRTRYVHLRSKSGSGERVSASGENAGRRLDETLGPFREAPGQANLLHRQKLRRAKGGFSGRRGQGPAGGNRRTSASLDGIQIIVIKRVVKLLGGPVNSCAHRGRSFHRIPSRILRAKSAFSEPGASSIVL